MRHYFNFLNPQIKHLLTLRTFTVRVRDLLQVISGGTSNEMTGPSNDYGLGEDGPSSSHDSTFTTPERYVSSSGYYDDSNSSTFGPNLPAPSINALFKSRDQALGVFRMLGMDKGPGNLRLDPSFFERHPELYDGSTDLLAKGIPIKVPGCDTTTLAGPKPIDLRILRRYQEMVMSTFDIMSVESENNGRNFVGNINL